MKRPAAEGLGTAPGYQTEQGVTRCLTRSKSRWASSSAPRSSSFGSTPSPVSAETRKNRCKMAADPAAPSGRLPDGTVYYGLLGELGYDPEEDKVQCHLCGEWLHQVGGSHLLRKHGWTIEQYRRAFRIPKRVATCGRGVSQQRREQTRQRIGVGRRPGPDGRTLRPRPDLRTSRRSRDRQ